MSIASPTTVETHSDLPLLENVFDYLQGKMYPGENLPEELEMLPPVITDEVITYPMFTVSPEEDDHSSETDIIAIDVNNNGQCVGIGIVALIKGTTKGTLLGKPYVGYTETEPQFREQGLGRQRLLRMNELSEKYFGSPIYSDPTGDTEPEQRSIWRKLVEQGRAEAYLDDDIVRYRFITPSHR